MHKTVEDIHNAFSSDRATADETLRWALGTFGDWIGIASSFGAEDVVLIDMAVKINTAGRILTLDTVRLHQETYDVMDQIRERYGINIEVCFPDKHKVQELVEEHEMNLFSRSPELRRLCCRVRKIEPLLAKLKELDAWVCGLRKEQAVTRTDIKKIAFDPLNNILKINPIAAWMGPDV